MDPGRRVSVLTACGLLLLGGCDRRPLAAAERPPDVVFVLADTLRADRLGVYGHSGGLSPTLDAIAREGVVFERALSQAPWTQPAIASLFASRYPGAHGVVSYRHALEGSYGGRAAVPVFDAAFVTLAEVLRAAGYSTAAFVANPFVSSAFGFAQGFDHFDSSFADNTTPGSRVNQAALAWLSQRDPERPVFLYLHYMDAHGPYDADPRFLAPLLDRVDQLAARRTLAPEELARLDYLERPPSRMRDAAQHARLRPTLEYWIARYEAGVRELDHHLAELRKGLESRGLWDAALVVITSDHGEALLDQGLWDHGFSLQSVELHVPLLLRLPARSDGERPAGRRVPGRVRLIDVMPTLLDELGLDTPKGVQGKSLVPQIGGSPPEREQRVLAEAVKWGGEQKAWYERNWKLVRRVGPPRVEQLHELASDPREQHDRAGGEPLRRAQLADALDQQLDRNGELANEVTRRLRELDPAELRRLQALGYLRGSAPADSSSDAAPSSPSDVPDSPDRLDSP